MILSIILIYTSKIMYVCLCKSIKDSEIRDAVENGHSSIEALAEKLGVGTCCGCCLEYAQMLIKQHTETSSYYNAA